jgi:hypothetical protein
MLYYGDVNLTECKIYGHDRYKPNTSRERTLVAYKKQDTSQSLLDCESYLCL